MCMSCCTGESMKTFFISKPSNRADTFFIELSLLSPLSQMMFTLPPKRS